MPNIRCGASCFLIFSENIKPASNAQPQELARKQKAPHLIARIDGISYSSVVEWRLPKRQAVGSTPMLKIFQIKLQHRSMMLLFNTHEWQKQSLECFSEPVATFCSQKVNIFYKFQLTHVSLPMVRYAYAEGQSF